MMSSQDGSAPKLPGVGRRRSQGTVERNAGADLRALESLGALPAAADSLRSAYRAMARQLDEAVRRQKTWDVVNASKELRSIRAQLLAEGGHAGVNDELEEFLAALPSTPRGYPEDA